MPAVSQKQNAYAQGVANGSIKASPATRQWAEESISKTSSVSDLPKFAGDANKSKFSALSRSKIRKVGGLKMPRIANYGIKP